VQRKRPTSLFDKPGGGVGGAILMAIIGIHQKSDGQKVAALTRVGHRFRIKLSRV
jgi:hypothetical protein